MQTQLTILFALIVTLFGVGFSYDVLQPQVAQVRAPLFSERDLLEAMWIQYIDTYLETDTYRTLDPSLDNITTSEGQSYTMLRSVWMDDDVTFDRSWQWTKDNLKKEDRWVFAWRFGERSDGSWGVQTELGGNNSATDADTDIALALILAYARWGNETHLEEARAILADLWHYHVIEINGTPYLLANDVEKAFVKSSYNINPSYFAPYAYRIFAQIDQERDWLALADSSYEVLEAVTPQGGLPPDWIRVAARTGVLLPPDPESTYTANYGFEAIRIPWRIALDALWFETPEATTYLRSLARLNQHWETYNQLPAVFTPEGEAAVTYSSPSMYGASLGYFSLLQPADADAIVARHILRQYDTGRNTWHENPGYYGSNWIWFGLALHFDLLINYTEGSLFTEESIGEISP
jgi:endo-1,4-beta-D-glucanase Y